jgi:HK97 family phage prohead protease
VTERRFAEFRADVSTGRLVGHAAVFDQETRIGEFLERIDRSAFDDVLDGDTVLQLEHQGLPLARTTSGTLRLGKDATGLVVDADPADTTAGRDLRALVARGDLYSMSFGFTVAQDSWERRDDGQHLRTIHQVGRLYDVSVVTFPAYLGTDVALRHAFGDVPAPPNTPRYTARGQAALIRARNRKVLP